LQSLKLISISSYARLAALAAFIAVFCPLAALVAGIMRLFMLFGLVKTVPASINSYAARPFSAVILAILGIRVHVEGQKHLESHRPCVFVANHQSALDAITMGRVCPRRTASFGKKEILKIPFFGLYYIATGNVFIDRMNPKNSAGTLAWAASYIRKDRASAWFFPEGTRNRSGKGFLPFKRGAFQLAVDTGVPVVPVVSSPLGSVLKSKPLRIFPGTVVLRVLPPIHPDGTGRDAATRLMSVTRSAMLVVYESRPPSLCMLSKKVEPSG